MAVAMTVRYCWSNSAASSGISAARTRVGEASGQGGRPGSVEGSAAAALTGVTLATGSPSIVVVFLPVPVVRFTTGREPAA